MTYKAIVTRVHVRSHPNADKLQIGVAANTQVIVGLDVKDGDLGVFFPEGGQLSQEFCDANDLCARYDEKGKKIGGGFFDHKRRVRAQNFRGVKSEGFWVPTSYFDFLKEPINANSRWVEGEAFDTLGSTPICVKYITPQTAKAAQAKAQGRVAKHKIDMPEHIETENIRYYIDRLQPGDLLTITRKLHGTSGRYGLVKVIRPITNRWIRLMNWLLGGRPKPESIGYEYIIGTRRTTLADDRVTHYYGDESFRKEIVRNILLDKGEILYFELVGYVNPDRLIMGHQNIPNKGLEGLTEKYGNTMSYTYGCQPGQCRLFVYRITREDVNGEHFDLSWDQIVQRCRQLGLETVPYVYRAIFRGDPDLLLSDLDELVNGESGRDAIPEALDPSHIQEGIVIRVDSSLGTSWYKLKSYIFGVLEGYIKDNPEYIDTEEAS